MSNQIPGEGSDVKVEEKYVRLEKWDNDPTTGRPDKTKRETLDEVWESHGPDDPLHCTYKRPPKET